MSAAPIDLPPTHGLLLGMQLCSWFLFELLIMISCTVHLSPTSALRVCSLKRCCHFLQALPMLRSCLQCSASCARALQLAGRGGTANILQADLRACGPAAAPSYVHVIDSVLFPFVPAMVPGGGAVGTAYAASTPLAAPVAPAAAPAVQPVAQVLPAPSQAAALPAAPAAAATPVQLPAVGGRRRG